MSCFDQAHDWSQIVKSDAMYRVYVSENSNKDLKFFAHIQGNQIRIIFSNLKLSFYFCEDHLFLFQDEISYRIPQSITVFINIIDGKFL